MIGVPDADVRVIQSFKIQRCNSPSTTSGSTGHGSEVLEKFTLHFHEGGAMREGEGGDQRYLEEEREEITMIGSEGFKPQDLRRSPAAST
jgi:hypothetical protein